MAVATSPSTHGGYVVAKYYVQCGPVQLVLDADSVDAAALSALDRSLQAHLWIYDDQDLTELDCRDHLMLEALMHLEPEVRVSEQGFDRDDAMSVGTPETVDHWHELMLGMRNLFMLAGMSPRRISGVAGSLDGRQSTVRYPR